MPFNSHATGVRYCLRCRYGRCAAILEKVYKESGFENDIFWCQGIFSRFLISKMAVKINLRILTKNHAADPEIEFQKKIGFKTI